MSSEGADVAVVYIDLMGLLLRVFAEVGGQKLVLGAVEVAVLPAGLHELDGPVADMLAVHVLEGVEEVGGTEEGDEAVAAGLARPPVSHHSPHLEGRIPAEHAAQDLVVDLVA